MVKDKSEKQTMDGVKEVLALLKPIDIPTAFMPTAPIKPVPVNIVEVIPMKPTKVEVKAAVVMPAVVVPAVAPVITFMISKPTQLIMTPPPKLDLVEHLDHILDRLAL